MMKHIKLFEQYTVLEGLAVRNQKPTSDELSVWEASFKEWGQGKMSVNYSNVLEFFQNNDEDSLYQENVDGLLMHLGGSVNETYRSYDDDDDEDEDEDEDEDVFYMYVADGDKEAIIRMEKQDGKWREFTERGDELYGIGGKNYQSYLSPSDILSWMQRDYTEAQMVEPDEIDDYINEAEIKKMELSDEDNKLLAKDFTVNGKYVFDDKLSDKEKEVLLKQKVEDIIKSKKLNPGEAKRVRSEWNTNLKKVGVGQFEDELKRRWLSADKRLTGGRLTTVKNKIKDEVWKGYKQEVGSGFNSLADIITGEY